MSRAQEPMNTGKQVVPEQPSSRQVAMQGAYRPKPTSIRAPQKKFRITATQNCHWPTVKPMPSPMEPKGPMPAFLQAMMMAVPIIAQPSQIRIWLTSHLVIISAMV